MHIVEMHFVLGIAQYRAEPESPVQLFISSRRLSIFWHLSLFQAAVLVIALLNFIHKLKSGAEHRGTPQTSLHPN